MIPALIYLITMAALNRLRGWDWGKPYTSKGVTSFASGLATGGLALCFGYGWPQAGYITLIAWLGIWGWAAPGWGRYFAAFHGRDMRSEEEIAPIDWLGEAIFPDNTPQEHYARGLFEMSLRGLFLAPLFIALSFVAWPFAWLLTPAAALQGPCYAVMRFVPEKYAVIGAEILTGFTVLGGTIALTLYLGATTL